MMKAGPSANLWAGTDIGSTAITLRNTDPAFRPGWFYVAVTGYKVS